MKALGLKNGLFPWTEYPEGGLAGSVYLEEWPTGILRVSLPLLLAKLGQLGGARVQGLLQQRVFFF